MKSRIAFFGIGLTLLLSPVRLAVADPFTYTTIDFPGATVSGAAGINNPGQIVGGYTLADGTRHGFLYSGGIFSTIDDPLATTGSEALGINDSGEIVGAYDLNPPEAGHIFEGTHGFSDSGGAFTTIDDPSAGVTSTTAEKINKSGDIVGVFRMGGPGNGFLDSGGVFSTVNFPGGVGTHANGINNAGEIVGQYKASLGARHQGFLDNGGVFTTIDFPLAADTVAADINTAGDIVGSYAFTKGTIFGFLYSGGSFSTIAVPLAASTEAVGINDQGDIVGVYLDQAGVIHGFEASPTTTAVPEPGTLTLLGTGLIAAWSIRRRRGPA